MKKIFYDTRELDKKVRDLYGLSEELMMENAASALELKVMEHVFSPDNKYLNMASVLVLAGKGNNGADGYALARRLNGHDISVTVCEFEEAKNELAKIQRERAHKTGVIFISPYDVDNFIEEKSFDLRVIVDCIFGSGVRLPLPMDVQAVIERINSIDDVYKIACDVPTGLDLNGNSCGQVFYADETVTMGALKQCLFSDEAKDVCGKISVANLGVVQTNFENESSDSMLLEYSDIRLPERKKQNTNKGSYGHVAVITGDKAGAGFLASSAALNFGAGLVTMVGPDVYSPMASIMVSGEIPEKASVICIGMGFGRHNQQYNEYFNLLASTQIPCVMDADLFYYKEIKQVLEERSAKKFETVLTPHPKEFSELLKNTGIGDYTVDDILKYKIELAKKFVKTFPGVVLLLKGAVSVIVVSDREGLKLYYNNIGTSALAKAGSGDVLSGLVAALLAQKYSALESAVCASLVHASAAKKIKNSFALTSEKLIDAIGEF